MPLTILSITFLPSGGKHHGLQNIADGQSNFEFKGSVQHYVSEEAGVPGENLQLWNSFEPMTRIIYVHDVIA